MILRLATRSSFTSIYRLASGRRTVDNPKFSQSAAFQGKNRGSGVGAPAFEMNYYTSEEFQNKKLISAILSLTAFIVYFGYLREPSDLDEVLTTPPYILTSNLERKMLREQIKAKEEKGESTELLLAELAYVDVKQEALRIQFEKESKK